jgi:hypothetical protein
MVEAPEDLVEGAKPCPAELRGLLEELAGRPKAVGWQKLAPGVYRLRFTGGRRPGSLVVKRLSPGAARRNELAADRWLPAVGLGGCGPPLLGVAAERSGRHVWHVYEDLGDRALDERAPERGRVEAAVGLIARLHAEFAEHPLLAECRLVGGELGACFYTSSVRDAIRCLGALRAPDIELSAERLGVRDRLLARLHRLAAEGPDRAAALREFGGPETLLHGDLWPKNVLVCPDGAGFRARLIDWDRAGVGPVSYDLSAFLGRFPARERPWVLDLYQEAARPLGVRLPPAAELNRLFETAECARLANCVTWRALGVREGLAEWGFRELESLGQWLDGLRPLLPAGAA